MTATPTPTSAGRLTAARWVTVTVAVFGLVAGAVTVVDLFGVAGTDEALDAPLWLLIYRDSVVVDFVRWAVLAAGALLASDTAGHLRGGSDRRLGVFWTLIAVGSMLLLIEATGRPLNFAGVVALEAWNVPPHLTRMAIVVGIAAVFVVALARYGRHVWQFRPVRPYVVAAFGVYAVAVLMAATGYRWYQLVGAWLDRVVLRYELPRDEAPVPHEMQFMEIMVQPSVEVLAAALLLALALAFRTHPQLTARTGTAGPSP